MKLPAKLMMTMGLSALFKPRTKGWDASRRAIEDYIEVKNAEHRKALGLNGAGHRQQAAE